MERDCKGIVQKAQPYLRSGKGTESRQQASQSSRRYVPKGGFVIDFTTQPLPKGRGGSVPSGCTADVSREVLIARQQRAAARLSAPKHSADNSPATKRLELLDLEFPDHPKPWGASRRKAGLEENVGPPLARSNHVKPSGHHEKVSTQGRPSNRTVKSKASRVEPPEADQQPGETLDDNDIFDDDAPLLSDAQISKTPDAARASVLTDSFQAGAERQARQAPVTSMYVRQLLTPEAPAPEGGVQKELLDLKDQITQAAAVLELEKQAFQRSRAEDETAWREVTKREERRLHREKAILSRQSQVLLKLPSKREKAEIETLSAALEEERRLGRAKDARHKLTVQRLQRHVTQLQAKVADLEDEVRWHARHAANAAHLPIRTGQLHSASVMPHKPEQYHGSKLPEGAFPHDRAARTETLKQHGAESSFEGQQPAQLPSSRPATPEHPEQQLCSIQPSRKQGRTAAVGAPNLHQASPALGNAEASQDSSMPEAEPADSSGAPQTSQGSGSEEAMTTGNAPATSSSIYKAGEKLAGGSEDHGGRLSDKGVSNRNASENGNHHSARQKPPAVSWQIEAVKSRKPAPAQLTPAKSQGGAGARSTLLKQLSTHGNGISPSHEGREALAYAKLDSSTPVKTGPVPAGHLHVQSALQPAQRPKARTLPPLPDFMSLETFRSPSYSQDMPRMEALYAATDRASAFPHKPTPQAEPAKMHHSGQMQDADSDITSIDTQSPSSGAAGQSASVIQWESSVGTKLSGRTAASADEYTSIKASLRSLQELLNDPHSVAVISKRKEDSRTGSSLIDSNAREGQQHDSQSTSVARAQGNEQPRSQPNAHVQPTFSNTPELTQAAHGAASTCSQQQAQPARCNTEEMHIVSESAGSSDGGQGLAAGCDNGPCQHRSQQDVSLGGADGLASQAAIPFKRDVRRQCTDSRTVVRFKNGDCKCSYTDGTVEYYYAKADTWHSTCPGGIEVYHFPSGQTEAHHPGGLKEIIFQDGSMRLVDGEGAESAAELELLSSAVRRSRPDYGADPDSSM